jgi:hypothetical protein
VGEIEFFICNIRVLLIIFNMFYAISPSEFESEQLVVDVETEGTITTGTMVSDYL